MKESLQFEELNVGDRWTSAARTITESDVVSFATLTGDFNPLHVDHEYARSTPFGRPIAHGLLGISFLAGLGSHSPRVRTDAFIAIRNWEFSKPTYIGDTVHVVTEVVEKRFHGRRRGLVVWKQQLINQSGEVVQAGVFETLVATAQASTRQASTRREDEPTAAEANLKLHKPARKLAP